jgi:phosphoesterase RecJ-like protein
MRKDSFQKFKALLKKTEHFAILAHWSPDGDAMGSCLALHHFLITLGKKSTVIVPNAYPEFLCWLPGNKKVLNYENDPKKVGKVLQKADAIFTLDFNSLKRIEQLGDLVLRAKAVKVMIDHHQQPESYADYYFHDVNACSTCELVYDFICGLGYRKHLDAKIAACLYTGLMTDTGSFKYPSVTHKTHAVIADLIKTGIKPTDIHSHVYDSYSYNRLRLLGYALSEKLVVMKDLPVAYFLITEKELDQFDYQKGDLEGIVNYPFSIKGIKVCALFNETKDHIKVSFRSKGKIDVNSFARKYFNGGGHINAAGGKSDNSLSMTENLFVEAVKSLF